MALDDDALTRALLMAGIGMIGAPTAAQGISRGGLFGLQGYDQTIDARDKRAQRAMQQQMEALQLATAQHAYHQQNAIDAAAQRAYIPGQAAVSPLTPNDDDGNAMPSAAARPASFNLPQFSADMFGIDPVKGIAFRQSLAKESDFGKVDAKDYTPESVKRFQLTVQAGAPDFSVLVPRTKMEVNNGVVYDPYAVKPGSVMDSPFGDVVRDPTTGKWVFNQAKINPIEKARLGLENGRFGLDLARFNQGQFEKDVPLPGGKTGAGFVTPKGFSQLPGTGEAEKPLTEAQGNAAGFGLRANNMHAKLSDFEDSGYLPSLKDMKAAGGTYSNWLATDKGKAYMNAANNFNMAVLRKESGATITPAEQEMNQKLYIPMPGDDHGTIDQKRHNRELAIEALKVQAGQQGAEKIDAPRAPARIPSIAEIQAEMLRRGRRGAF